MTLFSPPSAFSSASFPLIVGIYSGSSSLPEPAGVGNSPKLAQPPSGGVLLICPAPSVESSEFAPAADWCLSDDSHGFPVSMATGATGVLVDDEPPAHSAIHGVIVALPLLYLCCISFTILVHVHGSLRWSERDLSGFVFPLVFFVFILFQIGLSAYSLLAHGLEEILRAFVAGGATNAQVASVIVGGIVKA